MRKIRSIEIEPSLAIAAVAKGEPVAAVDADGAVLFTDVGAAWFKAMIGSAPRGIPGRPAVLLYATQPHNGEQGS